MSNSYSFYRTEPDMQSENLISRCQKVDEDYAISHKSPDTADTALKRTTADTTDKAPNGTNTDTTYTAPYLQRLKQ